MDVLATPVQAGSEPQCCTDASSIIKVIINSTSLNPEKKLSK